MILAWIGIVLLVVAVTAPLLHYFLVSRPQKLRDAYLNAVRQGRIVEVSKLVHQGVAIDTKDENNNTALLLAATLNHCNVVDFLLRCGANINAQTEDGATALVTAIYHRFVPTARVLLKNYPDIEIRDRLGKRALDYALESKDPELIQLLQKAKK